MLQCPLCYHALNYFLVIVTCTAEHADVCRGLVFCLFVMVMWRLRLCPRGRYPGGIMSYVLHVRHIGHVTDSQLDAVCLHSVLTRYYYGEFQIRLDWNTAICGRHAAVPFFTVAFLAMLSLLLLFFRRFHICLSCFTDQSLSGHGCWTHLCVGLCYLQVCVQTVLTVDQKALTRGRTIHFNTQQLSKYRKCLCYYVRFLSDSALSPPNMHG